MISRANYEAQTRGVTLAIEAILSMKYLLDTNILSEPVRVAPNESVLASLKRNQDRIVTATLVIHELFFGCYRLSSSRKKTIIETYIHDVVLQNIPLLSYCDKAAHYHAKERARLQSIGKTPSFVDGQIAAIAAVNDAVLVTRNVSDFNEFSGISVENWFSNSNV